MRVFENNIRKVEPYVPGETATGKCDQIEYK